MIKVCDAIMGTGKSQAVINFMNSNPSKKFIYISPYLNEATRIRDSCPELHFKEPSKTNPQYHFSKSIHTMHLIAHGENIATTHQAFKFYTSDMLSTIKEQNYTLIIDENIGAIEKFKFSHSDLEMAVRAGYIAEELGGYKINQKVSHDSAFYGMFRLLESRQLLKAGSPQINDETNKEKLLFWSLPPDLITVFRDVYILTYMFNGQGLQNLLKMHNMEYQYIGVEKSPSGEYSFSDTHCHIPSYLIHLDQMINILDKERLNEIGSGYHNLSMNWFKKPSSDIKRLQNNILNCFRNIWKEYPHQSRMWSTYKDAKYSLKGRGYTKNFVAFNARATNEFRDRTALAYCANLFVNTGEKLFYRSHGIIVDDDAYALSVLIQWIWRSAIRDGKPIQLYLPSRRMRSLLTGWIDSTVKLAQSHDRIVLPN